MEKVKSQKQLDVEQNIIEKMPKLQEDLLAIVGNVFNSGVKFSKGQEETPYGLTMDILTLALAWLSDRNAPRDPLTIRDMNRLKKYIGTLR